MDNYRSSNDFSRINEVRVPSGFEVESAALLPPVTGETRTEITRGGLMEKVDGWKSRGTELVRRASHTMSDRTQMMKRSMSTKTADMKRTLMERSSQVKPMIHDTMDKADREFHSNPTKWAGIAAGATFVLGMIGRELRYHASRSRAKRMMPELIIIETA
jgi:ElaB/YqjD/DUF883 family membrane-anchored ribosome-binding protein